MNNVKWMLAMAAIAATTGLTIAPVSLAQPSAPTAGALQRIRGFLNGGSPKRGPGGNGGSRGDAPFCLVNPGQGETLWTEQPLVMAQGRVVRLDLRLADEPNALWSTSVIPGDENWVQVAYDGDPLVPGEQYEWVFYQWRRDRTLGIRQRVPFQVMAAGDERDRIAATIEYLQAAPDQSLRLQLDYLLGKQLAADALQLLFTAEEPSDTLLEDRQALVAEICAEPEP
ncbi:hypothetical protein IQ254_23870 [Nodosilinea sp. LEGE 07088]|uniref:hypothetical protein n=1 Tax=Nodosilinea sp. LEGE 07088 TaxID=2777968 RepID=UPI00187F4A70|nr:hypothetical protein [Nodosilinea sp. LEGE 07088]MBE9140199.1 hypothetical protein [Nodosilinea sp. LEGE 07088]